MTALKLTYRRGAEAEIDLAVTAPSTMTVGELARTIVERDPWRGAGRNDPVGPMTLVRRDHHGSTMLDASLPLAAAPLSSGCEVAIRAESERLGMGGRTDADPVVANLVVIAGPDRGTAYPLRRGSALVGRDPSCGVCLTDHMVSKLHAIIHVGRSVDIIDTNSTNGVSFGGGLVPRATLRHHDELTLGDSTLVLLLEDEPRVEQVGPMSHRADDGLGTVVAFNRSPRVDPGYDGVAFEAPAAPKMPGRRRFPWLAMATPLLMGAVMFAVSGSRYALVFILISPLMVVGSYLDNLMSRRRDFASAMANFSAALADLDRDLSEAIARERAARRLSHPGVDRLVAHARGRETLLWTRRPEHQSFLDLRLGLATLPSRNTVVLPQRGEAAQDAWSHLRECVDRHATVSDLPVIASLPECGALGIGGAQARVEEVARALIVQLVCLHSPAEVVLAAVMAPATARRWEWLKWLPHTNPTVLGGHSPLRCSQLSTGGASAASLVSELDELLANRAADRAADRSVPAPVVVLVVSDDVEVDRSRLVDLAERGPSAGIYVVWLAPAVSRLPAVCRTFLDLDSIVGGGAGGSTGAAGYVRDRRTVESVDVEGLSLREASELARLLSPVMDAGARVADGSDLPSTAPFLALTRSGVDHDHSAVVERWREAKPGLRAMLGALGGGEVLHVDLCSHGPHALVGGTTGAGKSELLQTWLLSMAVAHDPRRVTFLLVDYKGGSAFGVIKDLPHAVGLVTDLNPHLVRRALTSLRAELTRRERIVEHFQVKDLAELERQYVEHAPARLVIVVDEFAALKKEIPEFVDGMVDIAQRGRSLGLHLILATQRPAGVITDQLRANTNVRIALRMADAADSTDVLGTAQAADFDLDIPGRAAIRTGPGRATTFQAAYAGGWTRVDAAGRDVSIRPMPFGLQDPWPAGTDPADAPAQTDIVRVVATIRRANDALGIAAPPRPWLPELPAVVPLMEKPAHAVGIVFGLGDRPAAQEQPPALFDPDSAGNMLVFGAGGSGKSTVLRTVALAAARGDAGACQLYAIDFGGRGLDELQAMTQLAQVIRGDDAERLGRLLNRLAQTIAERAALLRARGAATLSEYAAGVLAGKDGAPARILVLIDGVDAFYQQYPPGGSAGLFEKLSAVATLGRGAGVHLVMTAGRPASVPGGLAATAQARLVLRLASDSEYSAMGIRAFEALAADAPPGRGLYERGEVQVCVAGPADSAGLGDAVGDEGRRPVVEAPLPIGVLPDRVRLDTLERAPGAVVLGVDFETLEPVGFDPSGFFVVTGPAGSGRSTALATMCAALGTACPDMPRYLMSITSSLVEASAWSESGTDAAAVRELAECLMSRLADAPASALIVEGFPELVEQRELTVALENLFKVCRDRGHFVVVEGDCGRMVKSDPIYQLVRSRRCGIGLQVAPAMQFATIFGFEPAKAPKLTSAPPGRGLLVNRGVPAIVQVALPS